MKAAELLDAIGEAKEEYVYAAKNRKSGRKPRWIRWAATAACLCLVAAIGVFVLASLGGNAGGGGNSENAGLVYMYYDGPVMPLILSEENESITASRNVNFDFSPYYSHEESYETANGEIKTHTRYGEESIVTDISVLTNESSEDVTVTCFYPFAGTFSDTEHYPTITVNGAEIITGVHPGPYTGGYTGVLGGNDPEGSVNLLPCNSFDGYNALLSDGGYMSSSFDEYPVLDQPVTVYKMSDYQYTSDPEATNPTLNMEFYIDPEKTTVLTYGINGGTYNTEDGYCARHNGAIEYRPNASPKHREPNEAYIILVGEDIDSYTIQGYKDGGCNKGEELDDLGCTITRYESTLGEIVWTLITEEWDLDEGVDHQMLYGLTCELIATSGPLGDGVQRYDDGMLDIMISEAISNSRVVYLDFEVTIPAGESVTVEASMIKEASMDFVGRDTERNGYDMATRLGSNLTFTQQTASISEYSEIEILRQNFGFDLAGGITQVTLDQNQPHYWLEVRKIRENQ